MVASQSKKTAESANWQGRERRQGKRVPLAVRVELQDGRREPFFLFSLDVSSGGLFLLCEPPLLALHSELQMTIALPNVRPLLPVRGRIVRHVMQGKQTGVGVEFVDMPLEFRQLLDEAIAGFLL